MSSDHLARLVTALQARGGFVSTRRQPDGSEAPYELNISYLSALGEPDASDPARHARRFLTSQGLMLSLQGLPAIYVHSLVGTVNDLEGVRESGQPRRINRHKFAWDELAGQLDDAASLSARVLTGYRRLLAVRIEQPAFHPDAPQKVWQVAQSWLFALSRTSLDDQQEILVLANLSDQDQVIEASTFERKRFGRDLLTGRGPDSPTRFTLRPDELVWIEGEH